jgi:hypothetical protein
MSVALAASSSDLSGGNGRASTRFPAIALISTNSLICLCGLTGRDLFTRHVPSSVVAAVT